MKKFMIISLVIICCSVVIPKGITENIIIPDEAIRFRVIASSDNQKDQKLKYEVKNTLNKDLALMLKDAKTINESRDILKSNLGNIKQDVQSIVNSNDFEVSYGYNYFPKKVFKGITYDEGEYESLVVTLGKGQGKNWWCVLFPPLCLLEATDNDVSGVEYKSFVKEIISKIWK